MKENFSIGRIQNQSITILAVGSRGDVQPFCALAVGLQQAGHRVRVATHCNFEELVSKQGLEFATLAGDVQEILNSERGHKLIAGEETTLISNEVFEKQLADAWQACQGTNVIILTPWAPWGYNIAENLAVPCFMASHIPVTPTRAFPFLKFAQVSRNPLAGIFNYASYFQEEFFYWERKREKINQFRKEILGLAPLPFGGIVFRRKHPPNLSPLPVLYGISPLVIPKPIDWPEWVKITGYWFLKQATHYRPPKELLHFINDGPPPVCLGFGSMTTRNPQLFTELIIEALASSQQRGILLSGWAGLGNVNMPENVFVIDSVPHDWLFPQMATVVHHGGSGTTAAGLRAGIPSVILPFHGDQPAWGQRLADLGVSPPPIPYKHLSAQALTEAIRVAVNDRTMRMRAQALGEGIRREDGVAVAVEAIHRHLQIDC